MAAESRVTVFPVDGMTCQNCVQKIETSVSKLESVTFVKVSFCQHVTFVAAITYNILAIYVIENTCICLGNILR